MLSVIKSRTLQTTHVSSLLKETSIGISYFNWNGTCPISIGMIFHCRVQKTCTERMIIIAAWLHETYSLHQRGFIAIRLDDYFFSFKSPLCYNKVICGVSVWTLNILKAISSNHFIQTAIIALSALRPNHLILLKYFITLMFWLLALLYYYTPLISPCRLSSKFLRRKGVTIAMVYLSSCLEWSLSLLSFEVTVLYLDELKFSHRLKFSTKI